MADDTAAKRSAAFVHLIHRQRDFYAIAQEVLNRFDQQLDVVYQKKLKNEKIEETEQEKLDKLKIQLMIAREFSEKNSHELESMYKLALVNADDKTSKYHAASKLIVRQFPKWVNEGLKTGDQSSVISISQSLAEVNDSFKLGNPKAFIADFNEFARAKVEVRQKAQKESVLASKSKSEKLNDSAIATEWQKFRTERAADFLPLENKLKRSPQNLVPFRPSADSYGHISGRNFPAGIWALTFDDGPHPQYTQKIYSVLRLNEVSGTFFWLAKNIEAYPEIAREAAKYNFSRGSHSFRHAQLPKLEPDDLEHEITGAANSFAKVIGERPTLFRCPYGACGLKDSNVRQLIAKNNMLSIIWNVDTLDWQDKNPVSIFERTQKQVIVAGSGIILFHDIHPQSVEALKLLLGYMKMTKGINIQPLPKIISDMRGAKYESP